MARLVQFAAAVYRTLAGWLNLLQPVFLLVIRLYIGWLLFKAGRGKLMNIDATADTFRDLHIPLPVLNTYLSGSVEVVGGLALVFGLAARLAAIPLVVNMLIAYATAHPDELHAFFSDTGRFLKAPPFLPLLTAIIVLAFGPGPLSLDGLLSRLFKPSLAKPQPDATGNQ